MTAIRYLELNPAYGMPFQSIREHDIQAMLEEILRAGSIKAPPHNSAARLAMSFPPSASCKFLDLPPVNLRNLHLHLTKNSFASRPPHLCGVTLKTAAISLQLRAEHHRRCEYLLSGSTRWRGESLLSQRSCRSCFLYFDCRVRSLMGKCRRKSLLRTITITKQRKRLYRALKLFQSAPEK